MARLRPAPSDAAAPSPVHIELPWPLDLPGQAQVQDAQGCFNLNTLSLPAGETDLAEQRLRRLLELLDLPADIADQLLDWLDEDTNARFAGAEDDAYSRRRPPMRAANAPLGDVSELRLLPAMDAEAYAALAPLVCALPAQAGINVNSAPPLLLMALAEGLRLGQARDLAARAAATPFASLDAFLADPALSGVLLDGGGLTVRSDWFTVRAQVTLDQLRPAARQPAAGAGRSGARAPSPRAGGGLMATAVFPLGWRRCLAVAGARRAAPGRYRGRRECRRRGAGGRRAGRAAGVGECADPAAPAGRPAGPGGDVCARRSAGERSGRRAGGGRQAPRRRPDRAGRDRPCAARCRARPPARSGDEGRRHHAAGGPAAGRCLLPCSPSPIT